MCSFCRIERFTIKLYTFSFINKYLNIDNIMINSKIAKLNKALRASQI